MKIIKVTVSDIVGFLGNKLTNVYGDYADCFIDNLSDIEHTNEKTLDWINPLKSNKQELVERSRAKVIIVDKDVEYSVSLKRNKKILLVVDDPKLTLANIGNHFFVNKPVIGVHPLAIIDSNATIGKDVCIEPYSVIGKAIIGDGCHVSSDVRIYDDVVIGDNCYIKDGAVIGGPGFGFEIDENGNRFRFPQIGGVVIGNNVEIGANTCIDRGALSDTIIEDYAKIDNLCHIAHNVHIGKNAMIIACSEISGSCQIGENAWVGPNTAVRDWRNVGKDAFVGMGSNVVKDVPIGEVWAGNPAKKIR